MKAERPTVLMIGDCEHHEFSGAVRWLAANTDLAQAPDVQTALRHSSTSTRHTIVFAQSRPGQISDDEVEQMSRAAPLANLVALLGSWCEGETRSGNPWPGVVRVYWHQFLSRCRQELQLAAHPTNWQLPRTASAAERSTHTIESDFSLGSGLIVIHTRRASFFRALADACRAGGFASVWIQSSSPWNLVGTSAVLWDGQDSSDRAYRQLAEIAAGMTPTPTIALLNFPRHDDVSLAKHHGAAAVLPCPFLLPDLWSTLQDVINGLSSPSPLEKNQGSHVLDHEEAHR